MKVRLVKKGETIPEKRDFSCGHNLEKNSEIDFLKLIMDSNSEEIPPDEGERLVKQTKFQQHIN